MISLFFLFSMGAWVSAAQIWHFKNLAHSVFYLVLLCLFLIGCGHESGFLFNWNGEFVSLFLMKGWFDISEGVIKSIVLTCMSSLMFLALCPKNLGKTIGFFGLVFILFGMGFYFIGPESFFILLSWVFQTLVKDLFKLMELTQMVVISLSARLFFDWYFDIMKFAKSEDKIFKTFGASRYYSTSSYEETYGPHYWNYNWSTTMDLFKHCCSFLKILLWFFLCVWGLYMDPKYGYALAASVTLSFFSFTVRGMKTYNDFRIKDLVTPMGRLSLPKAHVLAFSCYLFACSGGVSLLVYHHPTTLVDSLDMFAWGFGYVSTLLVLRAVVLMFIYGTREVRGDLTLGLILV